MKELLTSLRRAMGFGAADAEETPMGRRVLFVCMGNICRSPTAEGVFRKLLQERAPELAIEVDSAGTHGYHAGHPPDVRARRAAERRGVDLSTLRARQVTVEDFARFELLIAMDRQNLEYLHEIAPPEHRERARLFLEFAPHLGRDEVPDPYYGGATGFEHVLDLVEEASIGLIEHLKRTAPATSPSAAPESSERDD